MYYSRRFFDTLSQEFGNKVRLLVKEWATTTKKLANIYNRKIFLLKCKVNQLIPSHIKNNLKCIWSLQCEFNPFINEAEKIMSKFRMSTLKLEIRITLWKLCKLENRVGQIKSRLQEVLPASVYIRSCEIGVDLICIFARLGIHEVIAQGQQCNVLYNFTDLQLPDYCARVFNLAPKVGIPLNKKEIPIPTLIKDIEYGISRINVDDTDPKVVDNVRNNYRLKVINSITNFYNRSDYLIEEKWISLVRDISRTKQFLKENKDVIVMRADKGGSTVVMKRDEYVETMNLMLGDETVYKRIDKDPTKKFQNVANNLTEQVWGDQRALR
ncbi:Protein of unknown function [Cotesia congregata]|uniref:Uncharacterized protein n=1 Tax=Cotesia congregata TaxID=51543 RepID=A0A8J2MPB4_COTCN|nr:Protein of unknown function [Cotesia congregata]